MVLWKPSPKIFAGFLRRDCNESHQSHLLPHRAGGAAGRSVGVCKAEDSDAQAAAQFIQAIQELNARMGIPDHLEGIREEEISVMAAHAEQEANPLYPVPRLMPREELEGFYDRVCAEGASTTI